MSKTGKFLFWPGNVLSTPGALRAIAESPGDSFTDLLVRHLTGDWSEMSADDRRENELSVREGFRVLSSFTLRSGEKIWFLTEADRSSTTALLPSEY